MDRKIAVIGLGYVGLPVAVSFGKKQRVIGYDISTHRIEQLKKEIDKTEEVSLEDLKKTNVVYTNDPSLLKEANFYIITVPTPIDKTKKPDLSNLIAATQTVAQSLKQGDIVVYESTVYPGATEEICIPLLEKISGLTLGKEFAVGYSPERISPGDKTRTFEKIIKIVSASDPDALEIITTVYGSVVSAGIFRTHSIKTAEAAKIIENTQRDLNVALMNELSIIFNMLDIDTSSVLEAAKTKWNFHAFTPGLVGGHCIGVDPYYLTYKAQTLGYQPEVILAGRRINDTMGKYVATQTIKKMISSGIYENGSTIGILGVTFKEDCNDIRNSKAFDIIDELQSYGINLLIHDPIADPHETTKHYHIQLNQWEEIKDVQALIIAVGHRFYSEFQVNDYLQKLKPNGIIIDVKGILDKKIFENAGLLIWRL